MTWLYNLDIPILKKGGIHIKKKNRGKFTEYCGGKVTEECIAKGKKSKDPKIRKRATFAANARKWKHENGGIIKYQNPSSPLLEKGYTTTNNEILQNPDTFNVNWYKYRAKQLQDVIKENPLSAKDLVSDLGFFENPKKLSNNRIINSVTNNFSQQLKDVKEFTTKSALRDHIGRTILMDEYYNKYPHLNSTNPDLMGPPKPVPDKELEPILRQQLIKGAHWPQYNTIIYDSVIGNDVGNKIHERTHALIGRFNPILNKLRNSEEFLRNKSHANPYYDDPEEIYARLMSIRKENNLDPTHTYTKDEIHKMRADKNFKDDFLINRYSDDFILMLLNDVAQNTTDPNRIDYKDPVTFAKNGGILKAQEGTGNNFWSKLWTAVKEGGMAARDAKIGAVGAQQVRDLYSEGKNQEAQDLAKQYTKANTTGIALGGGAASTGLLGDLMVTGATTVADTFIDGDVDNFGENLVKNMAGDLIGHGALKGIKYFNGKPIFVKDMENGIGKGLYHLDYGDGKGAFNSGVYTKNGYLYPGKTDAEGQLNYIWFNESKPYTTALYKKPFSRTIIFDQNDVPGLLRVREQKYPIGQWTGKSGFVTKHEMVTSNPVNMDNATIYKRIPVFDIWLRTK